MTTRMTSTTVSFKHPFVLAHGQVALPAGDYDIDTYEDPIDGLSFIAYRRVSTTIAVAHAQLGDATTSARQRQIIEVDPDDLARAIKHDQETTS